MTSTGRLTSGLLMIGLGLPAAWVGLQPTAELMMSAGGLRDPRWVANIQTVALLVGGGLVVVGGIMVFQAAVKGGSRDPETVGGGGLSGAWSEFQRGRQEALDDREEDGETGDGERHE